MSRRTASLLPTLAASLLLAATLSGAAWADAQPATNTPAQPSATQPDAIQPPVSPPPGQGERIDDAMQYRHCIALARQKPQDGWEEALAWTSLGGGEPARHCAAIALFGLKQYEEAATRLEALARDSNGDARLRAGMLAQAGQAWLLAKKPEKAYAAQSAALKLVPDAPDLLVDRAESLGEAKNYKDAITDLNRAIEIDPTRADAYVFRASARRFTDDLAGAAADAAKALQLDPNDQDAWLESGTIKRLQGDNDGARKAWLKVLELAPKSTAADDARHNIEVMDVKSQ